MINLSGGLNNLSQLQVPKSSKESSFGLSSKRDEAPHTRTSGNDKKSFSNVLADNKKQDSKKFSDNKPDKFEDKRSDTKRPYADLSDSRPEPRAQRKPTTERAPIRESKAKPLPQPPSERGETDSATQAKNKHSFIAGESTETHGVQNKEQKVETKFDEIRDAEGNPITQKKAMMAFLQKMKDELGIQPEEVILAFTKLDEKTLMLPPDQAVDKFVQAMDMGVEKQVVARKFFLDMLKQSASSEMAGYLKGTGQDLSVEILSAKELRQKRINEGLENLNSKFFVDNQARSERQDGFTVEAMRQGMQDGQGAAAGGLAAVGSGASVASGSSQASGGIPISGMSTTGIDGQSLPQDLSEAYQWQQSRAGGESTSAQQAASGGQGINPANLNAQGPELSVPSELGIKSIEANVDAEVASGPTAESMEMALGQKQIKLTPTVAGTPYASSENVAPTPTQASGQVSPDKIVIANQASAESEMGAEGEGAEAGNGGLQQMGQQAQSTQSKSSQQFVMQKPIVTGADEAASVRDVVNNAQVLIRRGGGEMKVQMSPEGMGEVTLKVAMQNGGVNVEMVAESNDAKKMLEKGLGELKATLASHKLNVDGIKVDTSQQLAADLNDQREPDERYQAQRFMEEFRQGNQSWRHNFYGVPGASTVESQFADGSNESRVEEQTTRRKPTSQRRLDMVA